MGKPSALLVIAALLVAVLLIASTAFAQISADRDSGSVTLILTIDKSRFSPRGIEGLGGHVEYVVDLAPVAIVRVPSHVVDKVAKLPGILHVSRDALVSISAPPISPPGKGGGEEEQPPQTTPWGVSYINAPNVWSSFNVTGYVPTDKHGTSVIEVAVVDTGVDTDHPDLSGNLGFCVTVLTRGINQKIAYGKCEDDNGHGTHVAGTVAALDNGIGVVGVAPTVEVYVAKALDRRGTGYVSDIIKAIDIVVKGPDGVVDSDGDGVVAGDSDDDAPEVISMSFGGDSDVPELHLVLQAAYSYNITLVAAAGNEGAGSPSYPAAYPEVVAVGAVDESGSVPSWSNRNPEVAAPGVDILSTYPDDSYATLSGTSMAAPHVSGTVALIQAARLLHNLTLLPPGEENDASNTTVRGILHLAATDMGYSGYDSLYGYGVVNAYEAVKSAIAGES
ncbi:MAG: S8 family peptidase [Thermoproteota archaeon]